jgi:hypothetical protein
MTFAMPSVLPWNCIGGFRFLISHGWLIGSFLLVLLSFIPPLFGVDAIFASNTRNVVKRETVREHNGSIRREYSYNHRVVQQPAITDSRPGTGRLSLHVNAWSREDNSRRAQQANLQGALNYGYLQYAAPHNHLHLNIGRQYVSDGVAANARFDGLNLLKRWGSYFSTTLFGGLPPTIAEPNATQEGFIYGGRLVHHMDDLYQIGLSYQNGASGDIQAATFLRISWSDHIALHGVSDIDPEARQFREHSYAGRLVYMGLRLDPTYQLFRYANRYARDRKENNYFGFLNDGTEIMNIAGSDIHSSHFGRLELGLRGRRYHFEFRDEIAYYYAGLLTYNTQGGSRLVFEAGRMDGETPENSYNIFRGHFHWKNPFNLKGFLGVDGLYTAYDELVQGKDDTLQLSMSVGGRLWHDNLEIRLSGTYRRDFHSEGVTGAMVTFNVLR